MNSGSGPFMVMEALLIRAAAFASQTIKSTTVGGYK